MAFRRRRGGFRRMRRTGFRSARGGRRLRSSRGRVRIGYRF